MIAVRAEVVPVVFREEFGSEPVEWRTQGETKLFAWNAAASSLDVTWDSSQTNSYFYLPLGLTLTRRDDFRLTFTFTVDQIEIGTTPGKPYTFQIAVGLLNTTNAFDPAMFRGAGIDPAHGPRNLLEFNYFPDSGFGATIAPTVATENNQIAFSSNHPFELVPTDLYRVELVFDGAAQTLISRMWKDGEAFPSDGLKPLKLSDGFADFRLNAIGIASYSDAGQTAPFAGSIHAKGSIDEIELVIMHRPRLTIQSGGVEFPTEAGWTYQLESTRDLQVWSDVSGSRPGTGATQRIEIDGSAPSVFFRVRATRSAQKM